LPVGFDATSEHLDFTWIADDKRVHLVRFSADSSVLYYGPLNHTFGFFYRFATVRASAPRALAWFEDSNDSKRALHPRILTCGADK